MTSTRSISSRRKREGSGGFPMNVLSVIISLCVCAFSCCCDAKRSAAASQLQRDQQEWPAVIEASQLTTDSRRGIAFDFDDESVSEPRFSFSLCGIGHFFHPRSSSSTTTSDIAIAAPYDQGVVGAVYLIPGSTTPLSNSPGSSLVNLSSVAAVTIVGMKDRDHFLGTPVAPAGDMNQDGLDDLLIGSLNVFPTGASWAVFGQKNNTWNPWTLYPVSQLAHDDGVFISGPSKQSVSYSLANIGDINGDGMDELMAGSLGLNQVFVLWGNQTWSNNINLSSLPSSSGFIVHGGKACSHLGAVWTMMPNPGEGRGDVNGDKVNDFVVSDYMMGGGKVFVIFGHHHHSSPAFDWNNLTLSGLDGVTTGFAIKAPTDKASFGYSHGILGDINHDGFADIAATASEAIPSVAYVVFGRDIPFPAELDDTDFFGDYHGIKFVDDTGGSLHHIIGCDVNGDGITDVVIGSYFSQVGSRGKLGRVFVVFGQSSGMWVSPFLLNDNLDGMTGFSIVGESILQTGFGGSVANAGDFNGDSIDDLLIGAYGLGRAYILFGNRAPVITQHMSIYLQQGELVPLKWQHHIQVDDNWLTGHVVLTVVEIDHCCLLLNSTNHQITQFTVADVKSQDVMLAHDSSNQPPFLTLVASDGLLSSAPFTLTVSFTPS